MSAAEPRLDPLLADPTRLSIVALLGASEWAEFSYIRDSSGISDSALSKQAAMLEKNGYIEISKGYVGRRPRTWMQLSDTGRTALESHVRALQRIVQQARTAGDANNNTR